MFNKTIITTEKTKATAIDIVQEINQLKTNQRGRRDNVFITRGTKKVIEARVEKGERREDLIKKEFSRFYNCDWSYIKLWENSFGDGEQFVWLAKSVFDWPDIEATAEKINKTVANAIINIDDLFDEVVLAKTFRLSRCAEWKEKIVKKNGCSFPSFEGSKYRVIGKSRPILISKVWEFKHAKFSHLQ